MMIKEVKAVYFSPTGTTRRVVEAVAEGVARGLYVSWAYYDFTLPGQRNEVLSFSDTDIVVFGTSVYAGRVPNVLLKFLETLKGGGACAIPIVLFGNRDYDDALIELRDILERSGMHTIAGAAFVGEHAFSICLAQGRPDREDMVLVKKFVDGIVRKFMEEDFTGEPIAVKGVPYPYRGYYTPRDREGNPVDIRKVKPKVNEMCDDCKRCVEVCPMGSIVYDDVRLYQGICIKCGACIKKCPQGARYYDDSAYLYHRHELEEGLKRRALPELFF